MIKKTLILISLLAWSIGNIAQTATQRLVVWQKSGEKVYFDISELPETTFEDGQLVITTRPARPLFITSWRTCSATPMRELNRGLT